MVCHNYQMCVGLKSGIEGAVHGVQAIWDRNAATEYWIFLLVDAKDPFNTINKPRMLCKVNYLWASVACFIFNFYRHWSSLILRNGNDTASFMHSR